MNFRKKLSKMFLIFCAFMFMIPNINLIKIKAADDLNFKYIKDSILQDIKTSFVPNLLTSTDDRSKEDEALFQWDFKQNTNEKIKLNYYIRDNVEASFELSQTNGKAEVKLNLIPPGTNYSVYYHNIAGIGKYVSPTDFINAAGNANEFKITNPLGVPTFEFENDFGFSVKCDNITFRFLWKGDKFYFMTNSLDEGKVYDFDFLINNLIVKKERVLAKLKDIKVVPFANDDYTTFLESDSLKLKDTDVYGIRNKIFPYQEVLPQIKPGQEESGVVIGFDVPKKLNGTIFDTDINDDINASIILNYKSDINNGNNVVINIKDILNAYSVFEKVPNTLDVKVQKYSFSANKQRVVVKITGLPSSIIYDNARVNLTNGTTSKINYKSNLVNYPITFTFPKFEVLFENGRYFLQLEPFKETEGEYALLKGGDIDNLEIVDRKSYEKDSSYIKFPLVTDHLGTFVYQVIFSPKGKINSVDYDGKTYSQIIKFYPDMKANKIGIANNFEILNYSHVVNPISNDRTEGILNMEIKWDIGITKFIDEMIKNNGGKSLVIEYDFNNSFNHDFSIDGDVVKKIFVTITKNGNKYDLIYDIKKLENGSWINEDTITVDGVMPVFSPEFNSDILVGKVPLTFDTAKNTTAPFIFPNIYYLNINPIHVTVIDAGGAPTALDNDITVPHSKNESITLDDLTDVDVPAPQNLTLTDNELLPVDNVSFKINYDIPSIRLKEYMKTNYPNSKDTDFNINVNYYISQNEKDLIDLSKKTYQTRSGEKEFAYDEALYKTVLSFSEAGSNPNYIKDGEISARDELRKQKIVKITDIPLKPEEIKEIYDFGKYFLKTYTFDGLDKNQKYYIMVDLEVTFDGISTEGSKPTNIVSVLTKSDKEEIDENEIVPEAPILFKEESEEGNIAVIYWNHVNPMTDETNKDLVTIDYEIIRLTNNPMDSRILFSKNRYEDIYNNQLSEVNEKLGLRVHDGKIQIFKNGKFEDADKSIYDIEIDKDKIKIIDKTLSPNQIYYYYVRSVRAFDGIKTYSNWSDISVTTVPVKPPINLKFARDKISNNPKTEIVIEFDAPFSDIEKLGKEFFLEYSIKKGLEQYSLPIRMNENDLKKWFSKSDIEGYLHFVYKIDKLKHNTTYSVKVRLVDQNGDASLYSNTATTKTDLDERLYQEELELNGWVDYSKEEFEKLKADSIWTIKDTEDYNEMIFKENKFEGFIGRLKDKVLTLPTGRSKENIYYFPSSAFKSLNEKDIGLRIVYKEMEVLISANAINLNSNEGIQSIAEKLKTKTLLDYYIKLSVIFEEPSSTIDNKDTLGYVTKVYFDVYGSNTTIKEFDKYAQKVLDQKIEDKYTDNNYKNKLKDNIVKNDPKEELVKKVSDTAIEIQKTTADILVKEFERIIKNKTKISNLQKDVTVILHNITADTSVYGYTSENSVWLSANTVDFEDGKAIQSKTTGLFAFAGNIIRLFNFYGLDGEEKYMNLISKYNLGDFLNLDNINVYSSADKNLIISSLARILGAEKGANSIEYLSKFNIKVSNRNIGNPMKNQDAINIIVKAYGAKKQINIDSYAIKNPIRFRDIPEIEKDNLKALQIAYEMGIYEFDEDEFYPNDDINIKDLFEMLIKIK